MNKPNEVQQDEEKGYRERKARDSYMYIGVNKNGKAIYEKDGEFYREEEHRYLVKTDMEEVHQI
jgi:hypothetical protein